MHGRLALCRVGASTQISTAMAQTHFTNGGSMHQPLFLVGCALSVNAVKLGCCALFVNAVKVGCLLPIQVGLQFAHQV